jgi:amino acid transporter
MTTQTAPIEEQRLGKPVLTTLDAIAQSMAIGPVFSAVALGALIAGVAGAGATFVTLLGAVASLCIGWVISVYARKYAGAGAAYEYLRRAAGPVFGVFCAGLYFLGILILGLCGIYVIFGVIASGAIEFNFGLALPWWVYALLAIGVVFAANYFGVKTTTRTQLILTAVSIVPFVIVALAIIASGGAGGNNLNLLGPAGAGSSQIFAGLLLAISLFVGFEAAAALGEETAEPFKSIPRAVIGTVIISAVFYLLIIYASTIGFGVDKVGDWAGDPSPLATLGTRYVGGWIAPLLDIALLLDIIAVASTSMITSTRGWFALARHGLLPKALTSLSKYDTPHTGTLLAAVVGVAYIVIFAVSGADPFTVFLVNTNAGILLVNIIYGLLAVFVFKVLTPAERRWWHYPVVAVALLVPILATYGVLTTPGVFEFPFVVGLIACALLIVGSLVWALANANKAKSLI